MSPPAGPSSAATTRVRAARPADVGVIARFNAAMALETEDKRLDPDVLTAGVSAVVTDDDGARRGFYRVAERGGEVVGCLMITREWSDWRNAWFWWIQSVYVDPSARRRGVLRALVEDVLAAADAETDVCGVRLYVERGNDRARNAYLGLGLREADYTMMEIDRVLGPGSGSGAGSEPNSPGPRP